MKPRLRRWLPRVAPHSRLGVCFVCAWQDPALQPALREYTVRKKAETIRRARELLARPLEFIDRLVERFR